MTYSPITVLDPGVKLEYAKVHWDDKYLVAARETLERLVCSTHYVHDIVGLTTLSTLQFDEYYVEPQMRATGMDANAVKQRKISQ
ncbi:MAG: hypothetical protein ACREHG_09590 [Candidatus Saccharimonadales bacterium]